MEDCGPLADVYQQNLDEQNRIINTFTSNAIEGNSFSLMDTKLLLDDGITVGGKTRHELFEVVGHGSAFDYMLNIARDNSLDFIGSHLLNIASTLHRKFYVNINESYAGSYRDVGIQIVGSDRVFPDPESLSEHMANFRDSFNMFKDRFHPVTLAAFTHLWFVLIHPFIDGNGRISRLLMNLVLENQRFQIINFTIETRPKYYAALAESDSKGSDHSSFIYLITELQLKAQEEYMDMIFPSR